MRREWASATLDANLGLSLCSISPSKTVALRHNRSPCDTALSLRAAALLLSWHGQPGA